MNARPPAPGLSPQLIDVANEVGIDFDAKDRAATVAIVDEAVVFAEIQQQLSDQIELLPIAKAVERPDVAAISWSVLDPSYDDAVEEANRSPTGGYYIRVLSGHRISMPLQACLLLATSGSRQILHNIIVVEEDAELSMVTGCAAPAGVRRGTHVGVTEIMLERGATLTDTMIHRWSPDAQVRPRTAVRAAAGATYISNYVLLAAPRSLQGEAVALLEGDHSRADMRSIVLGTGSARIDVNTEVHLAGAGTSAESIARAIACDRSDITLRAQIVGHHDQSVGRLDCRGLLQSPAARITATPNLRADHAPGSQLAHEATIGPISEEAIEYIMTRGVGRDEATAAITRGFLKAGMPKLSPELEQRIHELSMMVAVGSL
jgi:Fe-S cluster assembly scaffold protein SufB